MGRLLVRTMGEVTTEGKLWVIKELFGEDLLDKVTLEEDTKDGT